MPNPGAGFLQRERARIRNFFGLDLPPRTIELRLELVPPNRKGRRPPLVAHKLHAVLKASRATPREFMERFLLTARDISRYPMSKKRRLALIELLARQLYVEVAPALKVISKEGGGIPEQEGRTAMLVLYERCVNALSDSYLLILASDYERSNFWYARVRPRVYLCACRILELTKLHHRIMGLRYMPLPSATTRVANTVFVAMRACEQVDFPIDALSARTQALDTRSTVSLQQLYASLLSYVILDYAAWPEQEQFFIDTYCNSIQDAIRFDDYTAPPVTRAKDQLLVGCYQDSPPGPKLPAGAGIGPVLTIDYRILADSIRGDYVELSRARGDRNRFAMPPRLARVEPVYQTATGYLLYRNLEQPGKWSDIGAGRQRHRDLRIYTGYDEVRSHLLAIFRGGSRMQRSRELSNLFARRSAVIGEDDSATRESLWYVLYDNERQMRIKTQETRFTNRMFIGNLLAYGFGAKEVYKPRIGKVNRIFRPEPGTVIIDLEYLASFATPIALYKRNPAAETEPGKIKVVGKPLSALLIYHPTRGWGIITPPQDGFWEKTAVGIQTGKRVTLGELGEAQDVTNEFNWFKVSADSLPASAPDYPDRTDLSETVEIPDIA